VLDPGIAPVEKERRITEIRKILDENSVTAELKIVEEREVLRALVKLSRSADLVLMGGRTGDFIELLLAKSLAQEITEQVKCPVLWIKEYEERPSFWASLFRSYKTAGEENE
jgi:nucleotide-binding universal stress UspA family protein